jgi:hypothetical protein
VERAWVRGCGYRAAIKLIHAAHAKATQAIELHIAPGYEAGYRVKLPQSVELDGNWEVGLYSISYPNTWYTLRDINVKDTHFYYDDWGRILFRGIHGLLTL